MRALKSKESPLSALCALHSRMDQFLESKNGGKPVVLYGAGFAMPSMLRKLEKHQFHIAAICDSSPARHGTRYNDRYDVLSLDEAKKRFPEATFVVSAPSYFWEIQAELKNAVGVDRVCPVDLECMHYFDASEFHDFFHAHFSEFEAVHAMLEEDGSRDTYRAVLKAHLSGERRDFENASTGLQDWYLFQTLLKPRANSVYLDCGAFDGDTIKLFLQAATSGYGEIIAFEPDPAMRQALQQLNTPRLKLIEKGVSDHDGEVTFHQSGVYSAVVKDASPAADDIIRIPVTTIDSVLSGARADVIKMDIEGAEFEALKGARNTIIKHKPALAICLYHKVEDFIRIPQLLREWVPGYKLRIRHQSQSCTDTILFASLC